MLCLHADREEVSQYRLDQDLGDAISIMMFVEGYPKGKEPPATWFYRVLLTNLPAFYTLYIVLLAAALIVSRVRIEIDAGEGNTSSRHVLKGIDKGFRGELQGRGLGGCTLSA